MPTTVQLVKLSALTQIQSDLTAAVAASASSASTSAANAAASAATALNAQATEYLGTIAGSSVPATATTKGQYYIISSAGTSQSVTWSLGDKAIYNGSSGSWSRVTGFLAAATAEDDRRVAATLSAAALRFDGTAPAAFTIAAIGFSSWSIVGFARVDSIGSPLSLVGSSPLTSDSATQVYIEADGTLAIGRPGTPTVHKSTATISAGVPFFFGITYSSGTLKLWVNGTSTSLGVSLPSQTFPWDRLGAFYWTSGIGGPNANQSILRGALARASILNFALSDAEVLDLATNRLGVLPVEWQRGSMTSLNLNGEFSVDPTTAPGGSHVLDAGITWTGSAITYATAGGGFLRLHGSANSGAWLRSGFRYRVQFTVSGWSAGTFTVRDNGGGTSGFTNLVGTNALAGNGTLAIEFTYIGIGTNIMIGGFSGPLTATVDDLIVRQLGALFIQPDADKGAGPALRGNYGLPDLILPGDGHSAGGVYRPAPLLSGPVDIEADIAGTSGNVFVLGSDAQRIPPGWAVVQARVFTPTGQGAANITLGTSSGGTQICGSTAVSANAFVTASLAAAQPIFATGTRLYLNRSATLDAGSRLILTIAPVTP